MNSQLMNYNYRPRLMLAFTSSGIQGRFVFAGKNKNTDGQNKTSQNVSVG